MDGPQRAHVDDHASADLGLAERLMALAARGDPEPEATREPNHPADVVDRSRTEHGRRLLVNDLSVVLGVRPAGRLIQLQGSVESGHAFKGRPASPIGGRYPGPGRGIESDDQ